MQAALLNLILKFPGFDDSRDRLKPYLNNEYHASNALSSTVSALSPHSHSNLIYSNWIEFSAKSSSHANYLLGLQGM